MLQQKQPNKNAERGVIQTNGNDTTAYMSFGQEFQAMPSQRSLPAAVVRDTGISAGDCSIAAMGMPITCLCLAGATLPSRMSLR